MVMRLVIEVLPLFSSFYFPFSIFYFQFFYFFSNHNFLVCLNEVSLIFFIKIKVKVKVTSVSNYLNKFETWVNINLKNHFSCHFYFLLKIIFFP